MTILDHIVSALTESFFMLWLTLWPLILGFTLSGIIQAFVPTSTLRSRLGNHKPAATARAGFYGMVSSSCSYAASAVSKSLFAKGADFVTSLVFMFASTNLVIELGLVLIVLMGWQFALAEYVGGIIMITLLAALGGLWFSARTITAARTRVTPPSGPPPSSPIPPPSLPARTRVTPPSGPPPSSPIPPPSLPARAVASATYTIADITMLRRELLIGYLVAGVLATLVPAHVWTALFFTGHGIWTNLENAIVGPLIAILSFVCSIGNVPLAAALWHGGISFGGVISFIFADLITLPLLLVYRRYYGGRLTLRMLALFWLIMSTAGLITGYLFAALGLIPTTRPAAPAPTHFSWNYTTYLNIIFLLLFAALYWIYHNRSRFKADPNLTIDPVCGMQVSSTTAPVSLRQDDQAIYFCSDACLQRYSKERQPPQHTKLPSTPPPIIKPNH